jgi:hypothetical protein
MVARTRQALFRGVNTYCPKMAYASDMIHGQPTAFSLGKPALGAISGLSANVGAANALATFAVNFEIDATYGRGIRIDLSGVPGNAPVIRVIGEDYLGQPLAKDYTGSAAATTTTASGLASFKRITAVRVTVASTNAVNIQLGTTDELGLPYKSFVVWARENNVDILTAAAQAVWTLPVLTDPQTLATGDPRGTYNPVIALNGVVEIVVGLDGDASVNAAGNGGLHGIRHFMP